MPHSRQDGAIRPSAVAVLATALMIGGVLGAIQSLAVDDEMRSSYEEALGLAQLALETQHSSAVLRNLQARVARGLTQTPALSPTPDTAALRDAVAAMSAKLEEILTFQLSPEEKSRVTELKQTLAEVDNVNGLLLDAGRREDIAIETARRLVALSQQRSEAFENSLSSLVSAVRVRALGGARRADELNLVARYALIAFSVITSVLALLSVLLTSRTLRENRDVLHRVNQLAREDPLTGAINRRGLEDALPIEFSRAVRSGDPLTLVMIDLDHFKRYNDRRGHPAGDAVLRGSAQAWLKQLRPTDMLVRYGGEEFTLVLPGVDADHARQMVDRLRPTVPDRQTFSAGIATWDGAESAAAVLQRADQALLQAKKAGRNRSMVAGREPQVTLPLMVA
ncbi:MAG: GGDEF domain-containing protein [Burkholderiaceae bacterium]|nr:GGDEF domain-containing protein [Burkholderiaceae bacterium]